MKRITLCWALSLALVATPGAARAQSLFSMRGLGYPVQPVDARARVLGGVGVGLFGFVPALVNPAEAAGTRRRSVVAVVQPSSRTIEFAGESDGASSTRFPLIHVTFPMGRIVPHIGFGGYLDQSWAIQIIGSDVFGGEVVRFRDEVESAGGVAQVRVGAAFTVADGLALGVAAGRYTGDVERVVTRIFPDLSSDEMRNFQTRREWSYGGNLVSAGFRWDPASVLRLAGSVTWSGRLEAEGEGEGAANFGVDLPVEVAVGASGYLSPVLALTLTGRWGGWSAASDDLEGGAENAWQFGGGLEWEGFSLAGRVLPIRLGGSYARLPFQSEGATPNEWSVGLGAGIRFLSDDVGPIAGADLALERGATSIDVGGLSERFWRITLSFNLSGR